MREVRDALILNGLLAAAGWATFRYLQSPMLGLAVVALVIGYNLLLPLIARGSGHGHWFDLWWFLLPLSICQVVPDWVLSQLIGILSFPDHGAPRIGTVPVYMAGMWAIPLFWILLIARGSPAVAGLLALVVFAASEWAAPVFGLWRPLQVPTWQGIAHYVLLPEALLGAAAAYAYREVRSANVITRLSAAAAVSVFYTGALIVSYFLMQRAGL
ncbi:DUF6989 domain-containing protein [Nevskia ramosa]|uniref:DUF6989 domain-containing protein n=1 Tax=Nevskia ramosa TaxID=64002 RepID=UPI0003B4AF61|nr:hypothetical protein [Nevskia ramosa]